MKTRDTTPRPRRVMLAQPGRIERTLDFVQRYVWTWGLGLVGFGYLGAQIIRACSGES